LKKEWSPLSRIDSHDMARITIQVLEGFERGRVFAEVPTPVTIGREEDNTIQLNDERVSRFHVKIQEDGGRIILTDLDSTNGTRINGHPVQVRVLQHGDQLSIGRSLLLFGSAREIDSLLEVAEGVEHAPRDDENGSSPPNPGLRTIAADSPGSLSAASESSDADPRQNLFPQGPPELPAELRMAQMAQLSDVLAYIHDQLALITERGIEDRQPAGAEMRVDWVSWQRLLRLEMQLAHYLRQIADPR
jgi:pSer/pThr/pTyr-binding forkhead associated (FHA) protein